jgi:indole-3-glycerol phosphate synthase/phosphoribosylanthranilate isomerase
VNDAQAQAVISRPAALRWRVPQCAGRRDVVRRQSQLAPCSCTADEDQAYIDALRAALPDSVQIWKALSVGDTLPAQLAHVDKYVLDNGQGGSGQRFDWTLLQGQDLRNVMLAGGRRR